MHSIDKSLFKEVSYLERTVRILILDLKAKLITPEITFRTSLCGMVLYEVLRSKVEIDLGFSDIFSLVTNGKEFSPT